MNIFLLNIPSMFFGAIAAFLYYKGIDGAGWLVFLSACCLHIRTRSKEE